jgi:hypothetical protein
MEILTGFLKTRLAEETNPFIFAAHQNKAP